MTRTHLVQILVILIISALAITYWQMRPTQQHVSTESVRITMHLWPGYFHSFIAKENGYFTEEGVDVDLQIVEDVDGNLANFQSDNVDSAFCLQSDAMLLAAKGVAIQIVYVADFSNGGDVIVSKTEIKSIAYMKGKTISVDKINGFNHIFLVKLLNLNGLSESDVTIVAVSAKDVPEALASERIDAGQTWEPYQSQAIVDGYRLLASTEDAPGIVTDVLMFKSEFVKRRPEDVRKIVKALFRALKFREAEEIHSYSIMSKATGVSPGSLKGTVRGNIFPDLEGNIAAMTESGQPTSLYSSGQIISTFFVEKGLIEHPLRLEEILDPGIVRGIKQ